EPAAPADNHMRCPGISWQHGWCMRNSESFDMTNGSDLFDGADDVDGAEFDDTDVTPVAPSRRGGWAPEPTTGELQLEDRSALRRVAGLSTELTDITEVEYRQLRLERVVLVGVWTEGS